MIASTADVERKLFQQGPREILLEMYLEVTGTTEDGSFITDLFCFEEQREIGWL